MRILALFFTIGLFINGCSITSRDMFPEWRDLDSFSREWYSGQLIAAKELPIVLPANAPTYRFIWLRSFHSPVFIRVECPDHCTLTAKILSGAGGYDPGKIGKTVARPLHQAEENQFKQLLSRVNFSPSKSMEDIIGTDGARWILESANGRSYGVLDYWSPSPNGSPEIAAYVDLCIYMINLSAFEIPEDEAY